ncbi:MAG: YihY/virulence factor BrkB family protein [Chloroherpetonaceae bacterium]|nr:YihY/virulence factor BrkB family protein [Chthonomonadaceae bacterium]MDW8209215.1 YihY/virulence factor BrkB family protein [Chloroherpetonaceae bacterium]
MADQTAYRTRARRRFWSWKRLERRLIVLSGCGERPTRKRSVPRRIYCYLRRITDAYNTHQCGLLAGACAFSALLSVVPLLAVGISVLGFFMGSSESALNDVLVALKSYVPVDPPLLKELLRRIINDKRLIGTFGLLGLLFTAHQTFLSMQPVMNIIWNVPETRPWFQQRLTAIGVTLFALLLLSADLASSAFFAYLETQHIPFLPGNVETTLLRIGLGAVPVILTTMLFVQIYRYLPARTIPWKAAILGASVAALLWQASKVLFSFSLIYVNSYDRLYGSLGSVVILVVWIYYSMAILLLGAEVAADYEFVRRSFRAAQERAHSGADLATARGTPHILHPIEIEPMIADPTTAKTGNHSASRPSSQVSGRNDSR